MHQLPLHGTAAERLAGLPPIAMSRGVKPTHLLATLSVVCPHSFRFSRRLASNFNILLRRKVVMVASWYLLSDFSTTVEDDGCGCVNRILETGNFYGALCFFCFSFALWIAASAERKSTHIRQPSVIRHR